MLALPDLNEWDKDLMQIYIGEEDNWTPPQPCKELVSDMNKGRQCKYRAIS